MTRAADRRSSMGAAGVTAAARGGHRGGSPNPRGHITTCMLGWLYRTHGEHQGGCAIVGNQATHCTRALVPRAQQQQTTTLLSCLSRDYKQAKPAAAMHASADRAPSMAGAAGAEGRDAPLHAWHVHSVVSPKRTYLRGGYISWESTWKTQPCCWAGTSRLWRDRPVLFRHRSSVDTCPRPSQVRHSFAHRYGSRTDTM